MPPSAARCAILLFSLLPSLVRAVSLSDFTPRVENLSNQCDAVYNRQIRDCDASDLQTGDNCSVACISGLLAIAQQVKSACTSDDVAETSIIGVFLLGKGPQTLCSNIAATTLGGGQTSTTSTTSIPEQSSTLELSSQTTDAGTTIVAGTSTTAQATSTASTTSASASEETTTAQTTTAQTTAAQTTAAQTTAAATTAAVATTDDTTTATSSSSTTAAATTSSRATDLASLNEGSGGGSPFDFVAGNGSAPVTAPTRFLVVTLGLCALFFRSFS